MGWSRPDAERLLYKAGIRQPLSLGRPGHRVSAPVPNKCVGKRSEVRTSLTRRTFCPWPLSLR